jgi:hypothetical protein
MKKLLIFILIAAAGYFAYEDRIKERPVLEVEAAKMISTSNSIDIEAPSLAPMHSGSIQGTVKNVSDKTVSNIILKYKMDGKPVEAKIYRLDPGEQQSFSTEAVMVRSAGAPYYLEEMSYE